MKKILLTSLLMIALALAGVAWWGYQVIKADNVKLSEPYDLYIPRDADFEDVFAILKTDQVLAHPSHFKWVAQWMHYADKKDIPSGRYIIRPHESNRALISRLRIGDQDPVQLTIATGRYIEDIASAISDQLEADSTEIIAAFWHDDLLTKHGLDSSNILSLVLADSYEMYWDATPTEIVNRLSKEYEKFWQNQHKKLVINDKELSPLEITTLASIVEKETNLNAEKPIIAGVYLNRLRKNMLLQADPTVVYAVGDFSIRRVLNKHLAHDSPYNTYMYPGLPPGPICLPAKSSIQAVMQAQSHDYLFFCAKPGYDGSHLFAKTNRAHINNANQYQRWLNKEGIRR